ncbi:MAG TPA: hypothetical protein VF069_11615 [Streptosporangiaceae bacterium]
MQRKTHLNLRTMLAGLGFTAAATVALSAVTLSAGTAVAATSGMTAARGDCPSGYVCVYPGNDAGGSPDTYYRYGSYNLSNMFGVHLVVNNQTGGAGLRLCTSYGGQNCGERLGPGSYHPNLTPINSIMLEP